VDIQTYLCAWLAPLKLAGSIRLTVDVDRISFF
jgi:hypothetical protein